MRNYLEPLLFGFRDFALENIDTYLDEITAEMDDGITLDAFRGFEIGKSDPFHSSVGYPLMLSTPIGSDRSGGRGFENQEIELTPEIGIVISDTEPERLVRKQLRYVTAFQNMITDNGSLGGLVFSVSAGKVEYYNAADGNLFMNLAVTRMTLKRYADE